LNSSLWKAIKVAKDFNTNSLQETMCESGDEITQDSLADKFAEFFDNKIRTVLVKTSVEEDVYNERRTSYLRNKFFKDQNQ
jgi:hypothetical protein